jgi:DNA-binding winged helix-turn-helix (wHTH) protein
MEALAAGGVFLFDGFRLDLRGGGLFRRDGCGDFVPIAIGSRALDVLGVLVERPGDLVSRDAIIAAVWPATVVEDANLNMQIAALRRVLDDGRAEGSCIQTVSGRGYRFVAPVTRSETTPSSQSPPLSDNGSGGPIVENSDCRVQALWARSMPRRLHGRCNRGTGLGLASWPRSSALWASASRWRAGVGTRPGSARHASHLACRLSSCRSPISATTANSNISLTGSPKT